MRLLEEKLTQIFNENKLAGMAVAITDKEKVIYAKGFGVDNVERPEIPAGADSIYRIASITKIITGITIMRLVEQDILELDTLVKKYVPWLTLSRPDAVEQMTLRHLLSHTSGLPVEYTPDGPREESALEHSLMEELPAAQMKTFPVENVYLYSNLGIRLASYIAQIKTEKHFSALAQEYVLNPLNMDRTTFDLRVAATYPISLPHEETSTGDLKVFHKIKENAARLAAGGLYSNTTDLCKLARFLLNNGVTDTGEHLLSPDSIQQMFTPHGSNPAQDRESYGLTMTLRKYKEDYLRGHCGSAPPYATSLFVDQASGYGVVTLMNTQRNQLRNEIPELIFDILRDSLT